MQVLAVEELTEASALREARQHTAAAQEAFCADLDVECPRCGAGRGSACLTPVGSEMAVPHVARSSVGVVGSN